MGWNLGYRIKKETIVNKKHEDDTMSEKRIKELEEMVRALQTAEKAQCDLKEAEQKKTAALNAEIFGMKSTIADLKITVQRASDAFAALGLDGDFILSTSGGNSIFLDQALQIIRALLADSGHHLSEDYETTRAAAGAHLAERLQIFPGTPESQAHRDSYAIATMMVGKIAPVIANQSKVSH